MAEQFTARGLAVSDACPRRPGTNSEAVTGTTWISFDAPADLILGWMLLEIGKRGVYSRNTQVSRCPYENTRYQSLGVALEIMLIKIRTLDAGGAKLRGIRALARGPNPGSGLPGRRPLLPLAGCFSSSSRPNCALLRSAPAEILPLMPTRVEELRPLRAPTAECREGLRDDRLQIDPELPPDGMIEPRTSAQIAEQQAAALVVFSIGTGALIEHVLAIGPQDELFKHIWSACTLESRAAA